MARPVCPACRDNFSVGKVSALYRRRTSTFAEWAAPPSAPRTTGGFFAIGAIAGLVLFIVTAFTLIWLCMALSAGILAEMMESWNKAQAQDDYRRAMERWNAAYYCGTHDAVFIAGEWRTRPSAQLAQLLMSDSLPHQRDESVRLEPEGAHAAATVLTSPEPR